MQSDNNEFKVKKKLIKVKKAMREKVLSLKLGHMHEADVLSYKYEPIINSISNMTNVNVKQDEDS